MNMYILRVFPMQGALAYDTCKGTGTGQLGNPSTSLTNFGNLAIFAPASDLSTIPADGNLPNVTDLLCTLGASTYFTQQQVILTVLIVAIITLIITGT
jgi:hypothetical protein